MTSNSTRYSLLAAFATLLALIVVMLGAYTRLSDAGLGCPDWPGCYGHLTVPKTSSELTQAQQTFQQPVEPAKAWKEMVHRYFAGTVGVLILILFVWGVARKKNHPQQPVFIPTALLLLVIFQAVLGMWTVTWKVQPLIVSSHLLIGMVVTGLLWLLSMASRTRKPLPMAANEFKPWAILCLLILFGQLFLGAWTSTNYAAIVCPDFPFCQGSLFPSIMNFHQAFTLWHPIGVNYEGGVLDTAARIAIQMSHRYGAMITGLFLGIFAICLMGSQKEKKLRGIGAVLLVLLIIQIILGIGNVVWSLPLHVAVAHNGFAALLFLTMITVMYKLFRRS